MKLARPLIVALLTFAVVASIQDPGRDAADRRRLYDEGRVRVFGLDLDSSAIDFGDDASDSAQDGECDDPRFEGEGIDSLPLDSDRATTPPIVSVERPSVKLRGACDEDPVAVGDVGPAEGRSPSRTRYLVAVKLQTMLGFRICPPQTHLGRQAQCGDVFTG